MSDKRLLDLYIEGEATASRSDVRQAASKTHHVNCTSNRVSSSKSKRMVPSLQIDAKMNELK